MTVKIIDKNEFSSLVSPQRNQKIPIHNWFPFKHGYSKELVTNLISHFNLPEGSWVLDPFCGGGTTLLTCKEMSINCIGVDILPFSVFLSNVKTENYDAPKLKKYLEEFDQTQSNYPEIRLPDIGIINKAFDSNVKIELFKIKQKIEAIDDPKIRALFGLVSCNI
jgi:hypothetical protein